VKTLLNPFFRRYRVKKAPFISEKISSIVEEIENELEKLEGKTQKKNK